MQSLAKPRRELRLAFRVPFRVTDERGQEMQRRAAAVERGDLKNGKGAWSTSSILTDTPFSFQTRFENGIGTNPEEQRAAAHAGCFAMALSVQLGKDGLTPENLETRVTIGNQEAFDTAVKASETGCPVSKLFKAKISVDARLEVMA